MKKLLFILFFPFLLSAQTVVKYRTVYQDTSRVFSTAYGINDTLHNKSREWFYRPVRFDSAVTFGTTISVTGVSTFSDSASFTKIKMAANANREISLNNRTGTGTGYNLTVMAGLASQATTAAVGGNLVLRGGGGDVDGTGGAAYLYGGSSGTPTYGNTYVGHDGSAARGNTILGTVTTGTWQGADIDIAYLDTTKLFVKTQNNVVTNENRYTARQYLTSAAVDTIDSKSTSTVYVSDTLDLIRGRLNSGIRFSGGEVTAYSPNYLGNSNANRYAFAYGRNDSIYSTATSNSGENFIFGNENIIGRTNPSGSYGNWLFGQYLRSENLGIWALGADDAFQKKIIPFEGAIVFVNEDVIHWGSNPMSSIFSTMRDISYGIGSPHVKDTLFFGYTYQKYGSASDDTGWAALHFHGFRNHIIDGTRIDFQDRTMRYWTINQSDDDAIHFFSRNVSGRPIAQYPMVLDSGSFRVTLGGADADSFQLNGTTFATKATWHSGIGASSLGNISTGTITGTGINSGGEILYEFNNSASRAANNRSSIALRLSGNTNSRFRLRHVQTNSTDDNSYFDMQQPNGSTIMVMTRAGAMTLGSVSGTGTGSFTAGAISGTTGTFSSTLLAGSGSVALSHQISSNNAVNLTLYRGTNSQDATTQLVFATQNAAATQTAYSFVGGARQGSAVGIESGELLMGTKRAGTMYTGVKLDSNLSLALIYPGTSIAANPSAISRFVVVGLNTQLYLTRWYAGRGGATPSEVANIDSTGGAMFSGLSTFNGTNSGRATVGAGDSVQVSVTGFTTSGEVQVSYYGANSTFTKHAHWGYRRADGFTIYGDAGAIVSYFVHKK